MLATSLATLGIHIPVPPILIFALLSFLVAVWLVISWMFHYHWKNYGTSKLEVLTMTFFYNAGSAILLLLTAASAILYYASST